MALSELQRMQDQYLKRAQTGDPEEAINNLYRLMRQMEGTEEQLSSEWLQVWAKGKAAAKYFPDHVFGEIESILSKIETLDPGIQKLALGPRDKACVVLGAGASAPEPSSIPTVAELLPELWRRARRLGREEIDRLMEWCNSHAIKNIEDLLTAAYIANYTAKNTAVTGLLDFFLFHRDKRRSEEGEEYYSPRRGPMLSQVDTGSIALLQDTLQILFGLLTGTMIPAKPNAGHEALVSFLKKHSETSIVTTNYDGCIDEALLRAEVPINTLIAGDLEKGEGIDLIKIHGSINWSYCDSCHEVREFDLLKAKQSYLSDSQSYAVIGICKKCQGQRRPLLIPPLGLKFIMFPNLIRLWDAARALIEQAKVLVVVGYSFAEADTYINKIIERSMTVNDKQQMLICDTNGALVPNLRKRFAARIDDFDKSRVLQAVGSVDKMLPQVLGMLAGPQPTKDTKSRPDSSIAKQRSTTNKHKKPRGKVSKQHKK